MKKIFTLVLALGVALIALQSCGGRKEVKLSDDPKENAKIFVESIMDYVNDGDSIAFDNVVTQLCDKYDNGPFQEMMTFGIAAQQNMSRLSPEDSQKLTDKFSEMMKFESFRRIQTLGPSRNQVPSVRPDIKSDLPADYSDVDDM